MVPRAVARAPVWRRAPVLSRAPGFQVRLFAKAERDMQAEIDELKKNIGVEQNVHTGAPHT